jgi:hypothetical protein
MMTPNEQNKAIAEYCGWTHHESTSETGDVDIWMNGPFSRYSPPDYHSDLNAIHEAEKKLGDAVEAYAFNLLKLCAGYSDKAPIVEADCETVFTCAHATSQQRAEAFLRTIGKWKE